MIDDAKKTVCISITRHKFLKIIADCRLVIIKALRRDVKFCIVLEKNTYHSIAVDAVKEFECYGIIEIRFVDQIQHR